MPISKKHRLRILVEIEEHEGSAGRTNIHPTAAVIGIIASIIGAVVAIIAFFIQG